ncbi:MAG: DUF4446 family protein [Candidatus Paceibacterota bacterium]
MAEYAFFVILSILFLLAVLVIHLEIRLSRLLKGKDAKTLEDTIISLEKETKKLKDEKNEIENYLKTVEVRLKKSIQSVETVRFNPFNGIGENCGQSFATAIMNERGDGVVLSSIHLRDQTRVFSKPIVTFGSGYELTAEEKEAIGKARVRLTDHAKNQ